MRRSSFRLALTICIGVSLLAACSFKLFQSSDDTSIVTGIQAKLFNDSVLKGFDVHIDAQNGIVTLSGALGTGLERAAVERIAGQQDGVKKVIDLLSLTSASTSTSASISSPQPPPAGMKPPAVEHSGISPARAPQPVSHPALKAQIASAPPPEKPETEDHNPPPASENRATSELQAYTSSLAQNPPPAPNSPPEAPPAPVASQDVPPPVLARAPQATASVAPPQAPPVLKPQQQVTIPDGTIVAVRMVDSIDSSRNQPGEEFAATLDAPISVGDRTLGTRGDYARIRLIEAKSAGTMTGQSELRLALISVTLNGVSYSTQSGYYEQHGASRGTRTAETVGGGAVVGAILGGLLGRGKGAAIGSIAGAGAGTAVQASTKGQQVKVPSETKLDFTLKEPVSVAVGPSE